MRKRKLEKFDVIYIIIGVAFAICGLFLPKAGRLAMLDVAVDNIILWGIVIYLFLKVKKYSGGFKKNLYIYALNLLFCLFCIWSTKNLVLDIVSGPQVTELYNVKVSKLQGARGIASLHYYIEGSDFKGKDYKIEISAKDYTKTSTIETAVITYYKNTNRLYEFGGAK